MPYLFVQYNAWDNGSYILFYSLSSLIMQDIPESNLSASSSHFHAFFRKIIYW